MVSFCFNICLWILNKIKVCKPVSDTEEAFVWVLYFVLWVSRAGSHLERICTVSREANLHTRLSRSFSFLSKEQLPVKALVILTSLTLHFYIPPTFKSHSTLLSSLIKELFNPKILRQVHYFVFPFSWLNRYLWKDRSSRQIPPKDDAWGELSVFLQRVSFLSTQQRAPLN